MCSVHRIDQRMEDLQAAWERLYPKLQEFFVKPPVRAPPSSTVYPQQQLLPPQQQQGPHGHLPLQQQMLLQQQQQQRQQQQQQQREQQQQQLGMQLQGDATSLAPTAHQPFAGLGSVPSGLQQFQQQQQQMLQNALAQQRAAHVNNINVNNSLSNANFAPQQQPTSAAAFQGQVNAVGAYFANNPLQQQNMNSGNNLGGGPAGQPPSAAGGLNLNPSHLLQLQQQQQSQAPGNAVTASMHQGLGPHGGQNFANLFRPGGPGMSPVAGDANSALNLVNNVNNNNPMNNAAATAAFNRAMTRRVS